jgi:MFS family permease
MDRTKPQRSAGASWGTTLSLALPMLLASLGTSIANIALPDVAAAFAAPFAQVQWVVIAYLAALTVSVLAAGKLGDYYGLKRALLAGLSLFFVATLLCGFASNIGLLVAARALQGIGAAFLMTIPLALVRETADEAHVGSAMGLLGTASAIGTALGPSLGGLAIAAGGWRGIFLAQLPLAMAAIVAASVVLPNLPAAEKKQASPPGHWALPSARLVFYFVANAVVAAVMMATLVIGPFYLGRGLGLEVAVVGLAMSVGPVVSAVSGIPSGKLVDVWGTESALIAGLALVAIGAFMLATLAGPLGIAGFLLAIVVLTPGYQLFQSANNASAMTETAKGGRGAVSGLLALSRNLGLIFGVSGMGAVFAIGAGTDDLVNAAPAAIADGMRLTFLLAGGLAIGAIAVALGRRRARLLAQSVRD